MERRVQGLSRINVSQGAAGTTLLIAASSGQAHKVVSAVLTLSADGTLQFQSAANPLHGAFDIAAKGGFVIPEAPTALLVANLGEDLNLVTTGGTAKGIVMVSTE